MFSIESAGPKDTILVRFTSRTPDGEIFESSEDGDVQKICLGEGRINPVFEKAFTGMKPGEKKEVVLTADKAYGEYKKRLVFKLRKSGLNLTCDPKPGDLVTIKLPTGQKSLVKILDITTKSIKVDANHPMAGKDLIYELELVEIVSEKR
ncbi:FKBP-type peptidyl-prolyl cis-trans isomerase 2 [Methanomicrobium sp. W14]|uniref:FKBP-type peptidyl-prolyl cis-trans isomerase n=1 Tax=Methanomicrobium sp. W14 TaxID=2817839 RepID=UPI0032AEA8C6|nr:FKBP-type peptidyl-prolyl cis-trans isomerase 2 [Methanomicrobium sp. W14]